MLKKNYLTGLIIALIIGTIFSLFYGLGFFISWRHEFTDALFLQKEPSSQVVIVAIDNESLQQIGRWPWPRTIFADLVGRIEEQAPAVIGLDVNFSEHSDKEADGQLARAIKEAGNVVLPIETELTFEKEEVRADKTLAPIPEIRREAAALGMTNTPPDSDGIFRRLPVVAFDSQGEKIYVFSVVVTRLYLEKRGLTLPQVPIDKRGQMLINYPGEPGAFKTVSAFQILQGELAPDLFKDKIVMIGATAPDLHDEQIVPTSSGKSMSGVEIHASAVETILSNRFLVHLKTYWQVSIFLLLALSFCLALACFKVLAGSLIALSVLAVYLVIALMLFDTGAVLDLFYPLLIFVVCYGVVVLWRYLAERKEKQQIKNAFSRYVAPDVINELLTHPEKLKLGGEKRELSIMFSDIRGFTSISEKLNPEQLVSLLNDYLSLMTELIMDREGVVDKYIGDAIMAFWGAPLLQPWHRSYALKTALAMIKQLKEKKKKWQDEFGVELNIGIGVNTGEAVVGNMGSEKRFDYTAMGDTVNLASRLEGLTKQYRVKIIVSEFTRKTAGNQFVFRYLDKVAVKGKEKGVEIYELSGERENLTSEQNKLVEAFEQAVKIYQKQDWVRATDFFKKLSKAYPDDGPTQVYLERLSELKSNPPQEWDGIYHAKSK